MQRQGCPESDWTPARGFFVPQMSFHQSPTSPFSFFAEGNLRKLAPSALAKIALGAAGEPHSIRERARDILDAQRTRQVPEAALSPHELELHRLKGTKIHRGQGGYWFLSDLTTPSTTPLPSASLATPAQDPGRTQEKIHGLDNLSDSQLETFSRSSDPATRTAAILILDKRSRKTDTSQV
jgi:hypothetical protein